MAFDSLRTYPLPIPPASQARTFQPGHVRLDLLHRRKLLSVPSHFLARRFVRGAFRAPGRGRRGGRESLERRLRVRLRFYGGQLMVLRNRALAVERRRDAVASGGLRRHAAAIAVQRVAAAGAAADAAPVLGVHSGMLQIRRSLIEVGGQVREKLRRLHRHFRRRSRRKAHVVGDEMRFHVKMLKAHWVPVYLGRENKIDVLLQRDVAGHVVGAPGKRGVVEAHPVVA
jgi:hypothetical protein